MNNENEIKLSIVLDDGSVIQGFAKIKKEAQDTAGKAGKSFEGVGEAIKSPFETAVNFLKSVNPVIGSIVSAILASGVAIKIAFDKAFEGEKLLNLEKQFDSLAEGAGISAKALKSGLEDAGKGMFNLSDQAAIVNKAIVELGASAAKLPAILELSNKVAAATGGNQDEVFSGILNAIETLNTKQLRSQGVTIDSEKAIKDYAKTLNLTASELNQAQKQQALLNAVLTQGNEKFKDVEAGTRPMADALARVSNAYAQIKEESAKSFNKDFGNIFAINLERIAAAMGGTQNKTILLESEIKRLQDTLKDKASLDQTFVPVLEASLASAVKQLENIRNIQSAIKDDALKAGRLKGNGESADETLARFKAAQDIQNKLGEDQLAAIRSRQNQISQIQLQTAASSIEVDKLTADQEISSVQKKLLNQELLSEQLIQLGLQRDQALAEAQIKFGATTAFNEQQRVDALLAIRTDFDNKAKLIEKNAQAAQVARQKSISDTIKNTMVNGLSNAFQNIGRNLAQGKNLFDNFGNDILALFGDMMIQIGTLTIAAGIATTALGKALATLNGAEAIIAGAALVVLGSAIKSFSGGSAGAGATSASTASGGVSGQSDNLAPVSDTKQLRETTPTVVVNLAGANILGDEGAGRRIVELVNAAFDTSGVQVRTGVIA